MNGIIIPKKKLSLSQQIKLKKAILGYGKTKAFSKSAGVSVPCVTKAANGNILSEQIIDKIIKAL